MYRILNTGNRRESYDKVRRKDRMRITQEFLNQLTPVELSFIRASITKLC